MRNTEISWRLCTEDDLPGIEALVKSAVKKMKAEGIEQWDEIYPARADWLADIASESLYAGICPCARGETLAVIFALNKEQDAEYAGGVWQGDPHAFLVLHRLCVNPVFQHAGLAKRTLAFVEDLARKKGARAIRLDMFPQNPYACKLYAGAGYRKTGEANWRKGLFYLMEKILD